MRITVYSRELLREGQGPWPTRFLTAGDRAGKRAAGRTQPNACDRVHLEWMHSIARTHSGVAAHSGAERKINPRQLLGLQTLGADGGRNAHFGQDGIEAARRVRVPDHKIIVQRLAS